MPVSRRNASQKKDRSPGFSSPGSMKPPFSHQERGLKQRTDKGKIKPAFPVLLQPEAYSRANRVCPWEAPVSLLLGPDT